MIPTLIGLALVMLAVSAYTFLVLAVFCPKAYRNGRAEGWDDGYRTGLADARRNVTVLPQQRASA